MAIPSLPPYAPPPAPVFTGKAPKSTPYGDFTAPDPLTFDHSPDYAYNVAEQQKAIQRSAAAKGSLLTGGLQGALQRNASGLASQDYEKAFGRALAGYTTNRDTNAQNFGQNMDTFGGDLSAFKANGDLGLGYAQLGQAGTFGTYDRNAAAAADTSAAESAANFARQAAASKAALASAIPQAPQSPMAPPIAPRVIQTRERAVRASKFGYAPPRGR